MNPDQNNQSSVYPLSQSHHINKRKTSFVVLISVFVATAILTISLLWLKQKQEKKISVNLTEQKALIPYINTFEIPSATVGLKYQSEIFASIAEEHVDLEIAVDGLPTEIKLGKCEQKFDTDYLPKPNTQVKCAIEGIPAQPGEYALKVYANIKNGSNRTQQSIKLTAASAF